MKTSLCSDDYYMQHHSALAMEPTCKSGTNLKVRQAVHCGKSHRVRMVKEELLSENGQ